MSKFNDLLTELDALKLPKNKYVIVGSGPLEVRGIRESQDLDILVNDDLWEKLSNKYETLNKNGNLAIRISDTIEVFGNKTFLNQSSENPTVEEQIKNADIIDSHPFQSLEHLKFFKNISRRQKDLDDIILLQDWINSRQ